MTKAMIVVPYCFLFLILLNLGGLSETELQVSGCESLPESDVDLLEFPLNLEYLEAEFFLWGSLGHGLDIQAPELAGGGPALVGASIAQLDSLTRDIVAQFAFQELGHLRAIKNTVTGFPSPLLNLSRATFATVMNNAIGEKLDPPFDPYANTINYLLASYLIPYIGLTGYVGTNPKLDTSTAKRLLAGLLGMESGQDAVIRTLLFKQSTTKVEPYGLTVAELTDKISGLRNKLGNEGVKDEGLMATRMKGAEGKNITRNVLAGNEDSLSFGRTPEEILRIVYLTGNENKPGGFYPNGAEGRIAKSLL